MRGRNVAECVGHKIGKLGRFCSNKESEKKGPNLLALAFFSSTIVAGLGII
jgi:hypothetical protein